MRFAAWTAVCVLLSLAWPAPASSAPGWPATLTIGTASPGGAYYVYGQELAAILTEALGIPVSAQSTQGGTQNVPMLESGILQLALTSAITAPDGWNGTAAWTHGKQLRSMRTLFPMYNAPIEVVVLKSSGIGSLADMAGKRVAGGPAGGAGLIGAKIFDALGIAVTWRHGAWETLSGELQSGLVDALVSTNASPAPILTDLDRTGNIRFVPVSADEIAKVYAALPEYSPSVTPAGTYPSMTTAYPTIGYFNFVVAGKDLPDDLVHAILKAFYANHDRMVRAVPAAREGVVENAKRVTLIPYHPGALRYYREIGVEIPAALAVAQ